MSAIDRVMNMITRGVVRTFAATTRGFNTVMVSLLADDPPEAHHFTIHGFASVPQAGADALVFQPSGNADHLVALVAGRGPTLNAGESAMYNDHDWVLRLREQGLYLSHGSLQRLFISETQTTIGPDGVGPIAVARDDDPVLLNGALITWLNSVASAAMAPVTPLAPGALAGAIAATSTKVFAE